MKDPRLPEDKQQRSSGKGQSSLLTFKGFSLKRAREEQQLNLPSSTIVPDASTATNKSASTKRSHSTSTLAAGSSQPPIGEHQQKHHKRLIETAGETLNRLQIKLLSQVSSSRQEHLKHFNASANKPSGETNPRFTMLKLYDHTMVGCAAAFHVNYNYESNVCGLASGSFKIRTFVQPLTTRSSEFPRLLEMERDSKSAIISRPIGVFHLKPVPETIPEPIRSGISHLNMFQVPGMAERYLLAADDIPIAEALCNHLQDYSSRVMHETFSECSLGSKSYDSANSSESDEDGDSDDSNDGESDSDDDEIHPHLFYNHHDHEIRPTVLLENLPRCLFLHAEHLDFRPIIQSIASAFSFNLIEISANTKRNGQDIVDLLGESTQSHSIHAEKTENVGSMKRSLIFIDQVDVLYEQDQGFWKSLLEIIRCSKRLILLACNDLEALPEKICEILDRGKTIRLLPFKGPNLKDKELEIYRTLLDKRLWSDDSELIKLFSRSSGCHVSNTLDFQIRTYKPGHENFDDCPKSDDFFDFLLETSLEPPLLFTMLPEIADKHQLDDISNHLDSYGKLDAAVSIDFLRLMAYFREPSHCLPGIEMDCLQNFDLIEDLDVIVESERRAAYEGFISCLGRLLCLPKDEVLATNHHYESELRTLRVETSMLRRYLNYNKHCTIAFDHSRSSDERLIRPEISDLTFYENKRVLRSEIIPYLALILRESNKILLVDEEAFGCNTRRSKRLQGKPAPCSYFRYQTQLEQFFRTYLPVEH